MGGGGGPAHGGGKFVMKTGTARQSKKREKEIEYS